jgi:hypothetical protein
MIVIIAPVFIVVIVVVIIIIIIVIIVDDKAKVFISNHALKCFKISCDAAEIAVRFI